MLAVYLLALQAFVGRQPFDLTEAEVEILEGPFIEYSGPNYALFRYYLMLKQMFYAALFVVVFVPGAGSGHYAVELAVQLALVFLVFLLIAVVGATNPRLRLDQAQRYYAVLVALALVAVGMSTYGL
jgi:formate hydrogenlyase subunit 4